MYIYIHTHVSPSLSHTCLNAQTDTDTHAHHMHTLVNENIKYVIRSRTYLSDHLEPTSISGITKWRDNSETALVSKKFSF